MNRVKAKSEIAPKTTETWRKGVLVSYQRLIATNAPNMNAIKAAIICGLPVFSGNTPTKNEPKALKPKRTGKNMFLSERLRKKTPTMPSMPPMINAVLNMAADGPMPKSLM